MGRKTVARRKKKTSTKKKQKTVRIMEHAVIPECRERSYADIEYATSREEKMWDPKVDEEGWFPAYSDAARCYLTYKQRDEGIPIMEAVKNSNSCVGGQYIADVLHESNYEPNIALQHICRREIPQKFIDKWKPEEMELFTEGIVKFGKNFAIIRKELLPHKRVEDFADFYYVWKRSSMAEAWRNARAMRKAEEAKKKEERSKKRTNKRPCNLTDNIPLCYLSNDRVMTRRAIAAARLSAENGTGTEDDSISSTSTSRSEKNEESSTAAESSDSPNDDIQKPENELPKTATSEMSPMKNEQISDNSMECPIQSRKRKLSIPRKIVRHSVRNFETESALEIKRVPAPIIPQWKRQRKCKHVV